MSMDGSGHVKLRERPFQEKRRQEIGRGKKGNAEGGLHDSLLLLLIWTVQLLC